MHSDKLDETSEDLVPMLFGHKLLLNEQQNSKLKKYTGNTCTKTPGDNSEIMPSLPVNFAIFRIFITAGRVCFTYLRTREKLALMSSKEYLNEKHRIQSGLVTKLFLTFPVAITTFTPLDEASFNASAVDKEIWLLLLSRVP